MEPNTPKKVMVMKVVILAGGLGTRLTEETEFRPKPMVEICGKPILWHIMKIYSHFGLTDFILCLGYKGYLIKEYFLNYSAHMSDIKVNLADGSFEVLNTSAEPWKVTMIDTGDSSMTGGRVKRIGHLIDGDDFCLTYGDGVAAIDISELISTHRSHGRLATVTAVQPPGRFGSLQIDDNMVVTGFQEKPVGDGGWINGGFFVLNRKVVDYIADDSTVFEQVPLKRLAAEGQLVTYRNDGFWQPMDTMRDKKYLEELWSSGRAPWCVWN